MKELSSERLATVLVATEGEWVGRALESVLSAEGYAVRRTQNGREALRLVRRTKPDALILDQHLADLGGVELCRELHDDPMFDAATPIILIAGTPLSHLQRDAAYAAGVWVVLSQPLDTEILTRQLDTFIRARRALVESRTSALTDPDTGLLSPDGLEHWAEKLAAIAVRKQEPLACVVLMAVANPGGAAAPEPAEFGEIATTFIEMSRAHMRQSDVIGRTTDGRLALLAPDTDEAGVLGFVQRLRSAIEEASRALSRTGGRSSTEFRAGYYALEDFASAYVDPSELIRRATRAVEHARRSTGDERTFNFNQLPLN